MYFAGGLVVQWLARRTRDRNVAGSTPVRRTVRQVANSNTNVPLFTKQYTLVPCEGFHVNVPYVAAIHGSSEQGEYCSSGSEAMLIV